MDENAPRLAKRLRTLKSDVRQAILVKACLFSAAMLGQLDAEVQDMLRSVEANGRLSSEEVSKALALAEAEKDKSYALEEQNAPREKWVKPMSEASRTLRETKSTVWSGARCWAFWSWAATRSAVASP